MVKIGLEQLCCLWLKGIEEKQETRKLSMNDSRALEVLFCFVLCLFIYLFPHLHIINQRAKNWRKKTKKLRNRWKKREGERERNIFWLLPCDCMKNVWSSARSSERVRIVCNNNRNNTAHSFSFLSFLTLVTDSPSVSFPPRSHARISHSHIPFMCYLFAMKSNREQQIECKWNHIQSLLCTRLLFFFFSISF